MRQVVWSDLAEKGLARCIAADRLQGARKAIELRLVHDGSIPLRRHPAFADRRIYVFTLFIGVGDLRGVVEINGDATIWHVGTRPQNSRATE
ncbi:MULTISPECIES: hypothetical protein [Bosea]|jgi:hypothetical protein|uniref:Uncharacterized protein n=1 Tax=Bosea rubneri TaxID=3075434 RepID=A0ABU3SA22_9HYPH|nr:MULTISPECIES: hypothetical protein [unclassified Bosea (in: a-proteobacteria)]MDU0341635.1 hypothetical protein [Bosea sp. ZW T0_25]HEV7336947.1 hypothetical protein [Bosea sp. (in: a-proteobacteria)]